MKNKKKVQPSREISGYLDQIERFEAERNASKNNGAALYNAYSSNFLNSNVYDQFAPYTENNNVLAENDKHWYENVFDFIKNTATNAYDTVTEDIPNSLRLLDEKINDGHIATTETRMSDNNDDKNMIAAIREYTNLLEQYRTLKSKADASGQAVLFQNVLSGLKEKLDEYDKYFKTVGKNNPVVNDLLYNDGSNLSVDEQAYTASKFIRRGEYLPNNPNGVWNATKGLFKTIANLFIHLGQGFEYAYMRAADNKTLANDIIKTLDENNNTDLYIINKLYNGQNTNVAELKHKLALWDIHTERLDNLYNEWYKSDIRRKQEGLSRIAIPFTDKEWLVDTSDPEDVPEQWRQELQVHAGEFWSHPLYTLPEVGSTIGLGAGMVGTMVADGLARTVIKELPTVMLAPLAKLLKMAKLYKSPQMIEKAAAIMAAAQSENLGYNLAKAGVLSADISAGIWLTKESRRLETAQEAAEAQKQRLLKLIDETGADPRIVYGAIAGEALRRGIDISKMQPTDLIGLALAYDIDTGDPNFDLNKYEARKGLMKLINANNALAIVDYAQALPFLGFGEKILSDFGKNISNGLYKSGYAIPRFTGAKEKGLWKAVSDNYKADVAIGRQMAALTPEQALAVRYAAQMQAAYDGRVYNFAKKLIQKDHRVLGLMANHAAKWAGPTAKKYAHVGILEGLEEGQQEIMQKRYQRGEYDAYTTSYSIFDIPEVFNNVDIAKDVIKAWFGIGGEDIDDIRKASLIGGAASLFFPFVGRAATGVVHTHDNHFINLIHQLNTDWAMRKMISDNYKEINDHNHLSLYYDIFRKGGADNIRVRRNLEDLKSTVDQNSTFAKPEYIEDDIQLMENAWTAFKDDLFAKNLAALNIKRYSPEYKTAVINYARALHDLWEDNQGIVENNKKKQDFEQNVLLTVLEYNNPATSEQRKSEISEQMPEINSLVNAFKRMYSDYKTTFEERVEEDRKNAPRIREARERWLDSLDNEELLKQKEFYNELEQYFVDQGELQDTNLSANKAYITRMLPVIRNNNTIFQRLISNAVHRHFKDQEHTLIHARTLTEEEYIPRLVENFSLYQQLKRADGMLQMFKDLVETQKRTRLITGRDIKTDKLMGMVKGLEELIASLKEEEKEKIGVGGLEKMFGDLQATFPNQNRFNDIIDALLLFTSISSPHRTIASAYMYDKIHGHDKITPDEFINALYGDTVRVGDPVFNRLLKISEDYKKLIAADDEPELSKELGSAEARDLFITEKRAAMAIVTGEIDEALLRVRIAHKQYEEDAREQLQNEEVQQQTEEQPTEQEDIVQEEPSEQQEEKGLVLDPSLEEDSIVSILDKDGEETRRKNETLRRMEENERKRRETQENSEKTKIEPETKPESLPENEPKSETKEEDESAELGEIYLVKIPLYDGLILRVGRYVVVAETVEDVVNPETTNREIRFNITLKSETNTNELIPKHQFAIATDIFDAYLYSEEGVVAVTNILQIVVVRPYDDSGALNAPTEMRLIDGDGNIIGMFVRTNISPKDDDPIITSPKIPEPAEEEEIPSVVEESLQDLPEPNISEDEQLPSIDLTLLPPIQEEEPLPQVEGGTPELTIQSIDYVPNVGMVDSLGVPLTSEEESSIAISDSVLADIDFYKKMSSQFNVPKKDTNKDVLDESDIANYFSQTLFYRPNSETPIDLKINELQITLKYPLRSGKELSKKLLDHSWLPQCYKYFVVTQAADAAYGAPDDPDSFTVTLIIEDEKEKASYAVSYRQLGKYVSKGIEVIDDEDYEREYFVDHEQERRDFLLSIHGEGETTSSRIENYKNALYQVIMEREFLQKQMLELIEGTRQQMDEFTVAEARRKAVDWERNKPTKRERESEDDFARRKLEYETKLAYYIELARDRISRKNRKKLSVAEIDAQIEKLRENRMQIINKYLHHYEKDGKIVYEFPSPKNTKRNVVVDNIVLSNGKFDNLLGDEAPVVNNLSKPGNSFGIANSTEAISKQIRDNLLVIGVGSGNFRSNASYTINDFRRAVQWQYDITRGGLAGKIYLIIDTPNGNHVPMMLIEQRFDKQYNNDGTYNSAIQSDKLKLCLDVDGSIIDESVKPSAAEVLLYLLTNNITSSQFSGLSPALQKLFADLFVNNGENTILKNSNIEDIVPQYAAKQLHVIERADGKNDLIIGLPIKDKDGIETGKYRQTYIKHDDLFDVNNSDLRRTVVQAIARLMHWNTDRDTMAQTFGDSKTNLIINHIEEYFKYNPADEKYSLYGVPEFTFYKEDLFNVDETGAPISLKSDVSVAAWMIKNGKLYTDVSDQIFKDPWVFVSDLPKSNSSDTILTGENNSVKTDTGDVDVERTVKEDKHQKDIPQLLLFDENKYKGLPGLILTKKVVKETPIEQLPKKILIADPSDAGEKYQNKEEFAKYLRQRIEALAKELNESGKFSVKITIPENIEDYVTKGMAFSQIQKRYVNPKTTSKVYPVVTINGDGTMVLLHSNYQRQTGALEVNGIYQARKTGGILNREEAVKWMCKKLGIPEHNILVGEIAMRSVENGEPVFGVMDAVFDSLRELFVGSFIINPLAGKGTHYHEAWHYVNLLLHDTATQRRLYDAYANTHPEYKGRPHHEIEEALAEEFRMWMELKNADGFKDNLKGIIKTFFYAVSDILHISGDKAKYRAVFRQINAGKYKKNKISQESLKLFQKFYKNGAYSIYAPGYDRATLDAISKEVVNSDDFLSIINALTDYIILSVEIRTADDLRNLCSENFKSVLEDIDALNKTDDISDGVKPIILVFLNNPEAIRYAIIQKLKDFGIITKKDSITKSRENEDEDDQPTEDEPWNIFDRFLFTVSKKTNAAFLAKLFLHTIPAKRWVPGKIGLELEDVPNDIIPVIPQLLPYDEVWNRILDEFKNLNNSWGTKDKNGEYEPYSLRWLVKKQKDLKDPLFATIDELLDNVEDDTQLKAALVTTLNSQKPNISLFELINAYRLQTKLEKLIASGMVSPFDIDQAILDKDRIEGDAFALADRNKHWKLLNDNSLKASRSIPRTWSNRILTYGIIDYKNEGKINKDYYRLLNTLYKEITQIISDYFGKVSKKTSSEQKEEKIDELKNKVVNLLNYMGVDIDPQTLNFYLYSRIGKGNVSPETQATEIKKMFNFYTTGTFGYILNLIKTNVGKNEFSKVKKQNGKVTILERSLKIEELYTGTSQLSVITKMALAKFAVHPGSAEYGVRDAKGNMLYPTSQNNFISSKLRLLNTTGGSEARKMLKDPYAKNSLILNLAKNFSIEQADEDQIKFNVHVGLHGKTENDGADYFGITSLEDYIIKMILLDQDPTYSDGNKNNESTHLILPTMADKKTYGDFSHRELRTAHDPFVGVLTENDKYAIYEQAYWELTGDDYIDDMSLSLLLKDRWIANLTKEQQDWFVERYLRNNKNINRFSDDTLKIFANYFLDEINALILYYGKKNIKYLIENPTKLKKNYHGSLYTDENGIQRIDFSGNGGLFRYFYDSVDTGIVDTEGKAINLNQKLEMLYNLEKRFIEGNGSVDIKLKDVDSTDDVQIIHLSSIDPNAQSLDDLDGFELIRQELQNIKNLYFIKSYTNNKVTGIKPTEDLLSLINGHILMLVEDEMLALCVNPNIEMARRIGDRINPVSVPAELLRRQFTRFKNKGLVSGKYTPYSKSARANGLDAQMFKSLIANHVANTILSIIEFEKVFLGDSSFFKYGYAKNEAGNNITAKVSADYVLPSGEVVNIEEIVSVISEKETDKIKRLGSLLSPGDEVMLSYTEEDYRKYKDLQKGDNFTNMVISDINARSRYLDTILIPMTKKLLLIDYIRNNDFKPVLDYVKKVQDEKGENNFDLERAINQIYFDVKIDTDDGKVSLFDYLYDQLDDVHKKMIESRTKQKTKPFGKINVADAQVLIRPKMYRKIRIGLGRWTDEDEEAFWILEKDASWMSDPEKAAKVQKLELFPLKMAYYSNDPEQYDKVSVNTPTLGKQAIFPWFKYQASSEVGKDIYERMNRKESELDFLSFDSAVKVGAPQNQVSLYEKGVTHLGKVSDEFLKDSDYHINKNGKIEYRTGDTLPVLVLDLKYLRYQLNTQAHKTHERAIGTQMFKIAFSNIIEDAQYGLNRKGTQPILGRNLRRNIMKNISLLTKIGANTIESEFYKNKEVKNSAITKWARRIIENNDLGATADDIIKNGYVAESLMNRKTFEQAISKLVNKEVIDISTNGGTAVQQSAFGWDNYDGSSVDTWDGSTYHNYNNGNGLKWIADNSYDGSIGTMLVFLGMNFFKTVVPEEYRTDYKKMRDWLVEHNIIGDKSSPFGLGYRIPTQGQSSIFTFLVADVLPEQQGDVIVVPYEFTAQTGSDFDVDKLFLSTFSYTDGVYDDIEDDLYEYYTENKGDTQELCEKYNIYEPLKRGKSEYPSYYDDSEYYEDRSDFDNNKKRQKRALLNMLPKYKGAILNKLLRDYMLTLSDTRMFSINRSSIDVISDAIHDDVLKWLKSSKTSYQTGMYELTPSFLAMKKQEFSVGKDGISVFALNITNLALTQYCHLALDFGDNPYGLKPLDTIYGNDMNLTADWLSAMINACVDVAKDPYIFVLNTNQATFDTTAFLLRSGKGISTFTFLAQPILKQYAAVSSVSGGIYGNNITGYQTSEESKRQKNNTIKKNLLLKYLKETKELRNKLTEQQWNSLSDEIKTSYGKLMLYIDYNYGSKDIVNKLKKTLNGKKPTFDSDNVVFDFDEGKQSILDYYSDDIKAKFKSYLFQIKSMLAMMEIEPYVKKMAELVLTSQIDTKKFGNDICKLINYEAKMLNFKYTSDGWIINTEKEREKSRLIPGYALGKYYSTMFLEEKFGAARKYTKELLQPHLFVASDTFETLFKNIAKELNGTVKYNVPKMQYNKKTGKYEYIYKTTKGGKKVIDTDVKESFNPFYNEDVMEAISSAINNVARFNILMNHGFKKSGLKLLPGYNNEYEVPVDFSFGGNFQEMLKTVNQLLIGNEDVKSLPARISDFISYVLSNPESEEALGIVEDGEIVNKFLNYLLPYTKTPDVPIDRLLLNDSLFRTNKNKKNILSSSWYSLFTHQSEKVRNLAKDIALYAYYTTYDSPSINSITDLIPLMFRSLYDDALKTAIRSDKSKLVEYTSLYYFTKIMSDNNREVFEKNYSLVDSYLDIICKNYWYDDNIVKPIIETGTGRLLHGGTSAKEWRGVTVKTEEGNAFAGIIATQSKPRGVFSSPEYVKIRKNGETMLYKKIGKIIKTSVSEKTGEKKSIMAPMSVYVAVLKAGLFIPSKKLHMFEFYTNEFIPSLFNKQNQLPSLFRRSNLLLILAKNIDKWNSDPSVKKGNATYEFINDEEIISSLLTESYNKYVYKAKSKASFEDPILNDPDLYYSAEKKFSPFGHKSFSDVIISINKDQGEYSDKTINLTGSEDFAKVVDEFINRKNLSGPIQITFDSDISMLTKDGNNSLEVNKKSVFYPTLEELDEYIESVILLAVDNEINKNPGITQNEIDDFIQYLKEVAQQFKLDRNVAIKKLATAIVNVINYISIKHPDVTIQQLRINGMSLDAIAAIAVQKSQKDNIIYKLALKVDRKDVGQDSYKDFLNLYKSNISINEEDIFNPQEESTPQEGVLRLLEQYIPSQEESDDNIQEEDDEAFDFNLEDLIEPGEVGAEDIEQQLSLKEGEELEALDNKPKPKDAQINKELSKTHESC